MVALLSTVIYTDGDGRPHAVGVLRNDGTGGLTENGPKPASVTNGRIQAGDLSDDGFVDPLIPDMNQPAQSWINDGTGNFVDSGSRLGRLQSHGPGIADIDGDGDLDRFITDHQGGNTSIWFSRLNQGPPSP